MNQVLTAMKVIGQRTSRISVNGKTVTVAGITLSYERALKLVHTEPGIVYEIAYQRSRLYHNGRGGKIKPGGAAAMSTGMALTIKPTP